MRQKRILLVDDNREIHNDFCKIISSISDSSFLDEDEVVLFGKPQKKQIYELPHYKIDSAHRGEEALELVKSALDNEEPYMLSFVDMNMPSGWDGLQTIKRIWEVDPCIQIVICSAYSEHSWQNIINVLGNSDNLLILKKPFDAVEILQLTYALTKKWELNQEAKLRFEQQKELAEYFSNEVKFLYRLNKLAHEQFSLKNALQLYIDGICELYHWPVGHIYSVAQDTETQTVTLKPTDIWYFVEQEKYINFRNITMQTTLLAGHGLPGRVFQTREPFWIEDVIHDNNFPRSKFWLDIGVHGALAVPIKINDQIIAIAEFFSAKSMPRNQRLLDLTDAAANQLSLLLERRKNEETLEDNYRTLEAAHTEMKNTQMQLLQHAKLVSIGQLAAGVAHEINNPIAFVTGNTEILQAYCESFKELFKDLDGLLTPEDTNSTYEEVKQHWNLLCQEKKIKFLVDDSSAIIKESLEGLERVRSIVADLKSFSHGHDDGIDEVDVNECLDITLKMVASELKYKCDVQKNYQQLPLLRCYPRQLNQVFMNLLVNASQAIAEKGTITLTTSLCQSAIHVSIQDTGEGIKPEHMENLFEPFFTTKPIGTGTGLGLSISYNIIQKHGGQIKVDTKVGEGTTFTIILPLSGV